MRALSCASTDRIRSISICRVSARRAVLLACCLGFTTVAAAQTGKWPDKPVRIIVATGPGGVDDFVARLIAPKLGELLGQQFVVENRPGVGGMLGQTFVLKSPPDGYTLLLAGGSMAGARYVNAQVTYDVLRDFAPVSLVLTTQFVMLVHPTVPARNLKEYIALARSQPGKMTYGTAGAGQIPYWSALLFNSMAGIKAVEVTYKDAGAAIIDVIAGRVDYFFAGAPTAAANKTRLRALAVTGTFRYPIFPEAPTIAEAALPGYEMVGWVSIMGPAGMRRDIVDSLNTAIGRALAIPEVRDRIQNAGAEATPSSPEALASKYADWSERFGKIVKEYGIKPQ
jgi:tripartite-type tricarboxylate transporter receptor subunit TctC